ncbi:MAG: ATP-binding protein [Bacteroidales bacterium]|nr:ATP-binding protein [Bacteroidales bacterium]
MEKFSFQISGGDYQNIGYVSNTIKKILNTRKISAVNSRRIAVSIFEVETNIILYARRGTIEIELDNSSVVVAANDEGKGIENVWLAMQEGYTTANEEIRRLGFGAGLGLSNINNNADILWISSKVNIGTCLILVFLI